MDRGPDRWVRSTTTSFTPILLLLLTAAAACSPPGDAATSNPPERNDEGPPIRVVSLDYGLTETILALGVVPVGVPDLAGYEQWVVEPELPPSVVDVGSTFEPNLELIQQLEPDLILTTPFLAGLRDRLERIAPTLSLAIYREEGEPYQRAKEVTRRLGERLDRDTEAESLIARVDSTIRAARRQLRGHRETPLYFVRFLDPRHVRVFGEQSLYDDVLEKLEMPNAWTGETNYWGFSTVGIEALATRQEARLFYLEPLPPDVLPTLENSGLWANLPFVEAGNVHPFP
ncbi:MAG: iron-siderophore ABC transporter substrate-binding protein, partial [Longimicrobiales bacterium]